MQHLNTNAASVRFGSPRHLFTFEVKDMLHAKDRWRSQTRDRKGKALDYPRRYNPVKKEEEAFQEYVWGVLTAGPVPLWPQIPPRLEQPLLVKFQFEYSPLKTWPRWKKQECERGLLFPRVSSPDVSNLVKFVEDALNGFLWIDDKVIVTEEAFKCHGANGPRTVVEVFGL